jgi:hypothetical protein
MLPDKKKAPPETTSENKPIFSASDMAQRYRKLKAEGRMPSLAAVIEVMNRTQLLLTDEDRQWLREIGIAR